MHIYQKLIFLVEENPLVKDFKDVEEIIGKLFGYREIKEISREERKESFNFGHGGRNQSYLLPTQETRIYKKVTPGVPFSVKITGYNLQQDAYYKVEDIYFFNESRIEDIKFIMKNKDIL